jgi:hypothetical protein
MIRMFPVPVITVALTSILAAAGPEQGRIDSILQQLEDRGDTVNDLKCKVEYTVEDILADDKFTKFGEIRYKHKDPNPVFYIYFEKMHQAGHVNRKKEWYIFDGRFLWEIKEAARNKIQHEVVGPGERIDLFDIEESPIPIPFGQKKDQIQRNFMVVLVAPTEGDPPGTDHLICTPKPDSRLKKEFERLEFFVSKDLHLPVKIVSVERGGNQVNTAVFPDLSAKSINTKLPDSAFDIPPEARKWKTVPANPDAPLPAPGR